MRTQVSFWLMFVPIYSIFFGSHTNIISVSSLCLNNQRSLLLAFKSELIHDYLVSSKIVGWNQSVDCCDWGGVTCDESGHVTGLDLSNDININGVTELTLPDSIGGLKFMSSVQLKGCQFSGPIPNSIQNLTNLQHLDLSGNRFTGSIPSFESFNKLEFLNLSSNLFNGSFPDHLLMLPSIQYLYLSYNSFSGQISESLNVSCYQLNTIDLSSNRFEGPIPGFIFKLPLISDLVLSDNNFNGSVDLDMFGKMKELYALELSYNRLTITVNVRTTNRSSSAFSSLSRLNTLKLASCKMQQIPDLKNQSRLMTLDLSDNELSGEIPNWIWEIGDGFLRSVNLSHNKFSSLQKPYTFPFLLDILDLHSNNLQGDIPIPPTRVYILDYSNNNFGSSIPVDFGNVLRSTLLFSISSSNMTGVIPESMCNASSLLILDLSNNSFTGKIPSCLTNTLKVLNLRRNKLTGNVFDVIPESCDLQTLDLSGNHLQGPLPESLANCRKLEVLDLGDNLITNTFPCWVSNLSNLHVFVIRSNRFHGNISCLGSSWTNLQIIDIASNRFSGVVPQKLFASFPAIMTDNQSMLSHLHFTHPANSAIYYQDSATVVFKGATRDISKILNIFTSVDFSNNSFQGSIPVTIGDLKLVRLLNLSHNAITGPVPMSIGNLVNLESLDLSVNKLNGSIPQQLASLPFLSLLNLSDNQLSGRIPRGSQFQTFTDASFKGNQGLCGTPLTKNCANSTFTTTQETDQDSDDYGNGLYVSIGLGFLVGFMIIVGPLVFFERCRIWYNDRVDRILLRIMKTKDKLTGTIIKNDQHEEENTFY